MTGWIKLHRSIQTHWIAQEPEALAVWVRLLMEANHSETKKPFNGKLTTIGRGQLIFGLQAFSARSGVSVMKLRRYLKLLEDDQMINRLKNNKFSLITIVNYEEHQESNRPTAGKEQASNKPVTSQQQHYKNVKNDENGKNGRKTTLPTEVDTTDEDYRFAEWMLSLITEQQPEFKTPNLSNWSKTIRLMRERDKRNHHDMARVWKWVRTDDFWSPNVMSADKFRKQYDRLVAMTNRPTRQASKQSERDQIIADRNRELGIDQPPQRDFIDGEVTRHD